MKNKIEKAQLIYRTIKYLKFVQIFYRFWYPFRDFFLRKCNYKQNIEIQPQHITWSSEFHVNKSFLGDNRFSFLNISHNFHGDIDWNLTDYGKLWTYNLNYFDFLNQNTITKEEGLELINSYIHNRAELIDGLESYPISLRGINWIKFLSKYQIENEKINLVLFQDYIKLYNNLEYHLQANHLLENGLSLLFGAFYFRSDMLYYKAKKIIIKELDVQILEDGAHFELSPMYHQIILYRILECYNLLLSNSWKSDLAPLFENKIIKMLAWLKEVSFSDGSIPLVNDSALGVAPSTTQLLRYGKAMGLEACSIILCQSGYRKFSFEEFELFIDVADIKPSYQPGHSHADTFNFILYCKGTPIFIDSGVSTYNVNSRRLYERSTRAHNTVTVDGINSSEIWSSFRVGRRAKVKIIEEDKSFIKAIHNGYGQMCGGHVRSWKMNKDSIVIRDTLNTKDGIFTLLVAENIDNIIVKDNFVFMDGIELEFRGLIKSITIEKIQVAKMFNKLENSNKILVNFSNELFTKITKKNAR